MNSTKYKEESWNRKIHDFQRGAIKICDSWPNACFKGFVR